MTYRIVQTTASKVINLMASGNTVYAWNPLNKQFISLDDKTMGQVKAMVNATEEVNVFFYITETPAS